LAYGKSSDSDEELLFLTLGANSRRIYPTQKPKEVKCLVLALFIERIVHYSLS